MGLSPMRGGFNFPPLSVVWLVLLVEFFAFAVLVIDTFFTAEASDRRLSPQVRNSKSPRLCFFRFPTQSKGDRPLGLTAEQVAPRVRVV